MTSFVLRCPRILLALMPIGVLRRIYERVMISGEGVEQTPVEPRSPEAAAKLVSAMMHRVRRWLPWG
jgi:hypothetical protein